MQRIFCGQPIFRVALVSGALALAVLVGLLAPGCSPSTPATVDILKFQIQDLLNQYGGDLTRIRIINQTGSDVVMDFMIDGLPQQIECEATIGLCDTILPGCPQRVEALQMRMYDSFGRFNGGANYNGNPQFTFEPGEFNCKSVLIYDFGDAGSSAYAL